MYVLTIFILYRKCYCRRLYCLNTKCHPYHNLVRYDPCYAYHKSSFSSSSSRFSMTSKKYSIETTLPGIIESCTIDTNRSASGTNFPLGILGGTKMRDAFSSRWGYCKPSLIYTVKACLTPTSPLPVRLTSSADMCVRDVER